MKLFAAVDVHEGAAVRLVQGDFHRQHGYGDPVALAKTFVDGGAPWLHVVDLDAARTGEPVNRPVVKAIAAAAAEWGVKVQTGGGVRHQADVDELLEAGLDRVVLGTAAVADPALAIGCAEAHPGRVALGLDYRRLLGGGLEPAVRGWTRGSGRRLEGLLADVAGAPLAAVVVTAIDRDGTLAGPDIEGLVQILDRTEIPVVASGGVGLLEDLLELGGLRSIEHGRTLWGVVVGKALADGRLKVQEAVEACEAFE